MTNLEKLMSRGADCVAGSIILRGKTMGDMRNGDLVLTMDGFAELEVDEVVVKENKPAPTAPAKTARAPKAAKTAKAAPVVAPTHADPATDTDPLDLGDLLDGDLE